MAPEAVAIFQYMDNALNLYHFSRQVPGVILNIGCSSGIGQSITANSSISEKFLSFRICTQRSSEWLFSGIISAMTGDTQNKKSVMMSDSIVFIFLYGLYHFFPRYFFARSIGLLIFGRSWKNTSVTMPVLLRATRSGLPM